MIETALRHALMSARALGWPWTAPCCRRPSAPSSRPLGLCGCIGDRRRGGGRRTLGGIDNADDRRPGPQRVGRKLFHLPGPRAHARGASRSLS